MEKLSTLFIRENYGETCLICEQVKEKGIHLYTSFLCVECEQEIIHTQTSHPNYKFYLQQMRKITKPPIYS
ncbi:sigma factor G inhibitor Gin [Bacillus salitolerans]|uniref:Sigma factor G inhibitor Gin n=1 Tax=Bacillus salitolerans TaxID=1437434 RepID=A0ABW4LNY1_9BACI